MIKKIYITLIICFLSNGFAKITAQDHQSPKHNYVILSKNIQQLEPIIQTSQSLQKEDTSLYGDFIVIFCGKTVELMKQNTTFIQQLKKAKKQNIIVYACGISLNKFQIDRTTLPPNIQVVNNGILLALQLKKRGYFSLTI